ncbi:MAG: hypothetical protein ABJD84_02195 [Reichenbachiella sp.]
MYIRNGCRFGFFVRRDSWEREKYAKVLEIEFVIEGKMIKGEPPYFGGFKNPPDHPRAGKIMGPRIVTLNASWAKPKTWSTDAGGNFCWTELNTDEIRNIKD